MRLPAFIFCSVSLLILNGQCLAASSGLKFSLILDKNEYKIGEAVNATFKLENKGKNPVYVNKRFFLSSEEKPKEKRDVFLTITSTSGAKLPCNFSYETGLPKTDYFELLEPGKEVTSEWKRDLRGYFDFAEPGTYKVVAVYQNAYGREIGLDAFKDKVVSEPVLFKVSSPDSNKSKSGDK